MKSEEEFIFIFGKEMIKHIEQTTIVVSWKFRFLLIISILLLINQPAASSSETILTLSSEVIEQLPVLKNVLNISSNESNSSSKMMRTFMRSIYDEMHLQKRRKRQLHLHQSSYTLSDDIDSIVSLFNEKNESNYSFEYHAFLEHLIHIELVLPIRRLTKFATIQITFNGFNLLFQHPLQLEKNFVKINLTKYIQTFPVTFSIKLHGISLHSPGFLTLYFQRSIPLHTRIRRDLSSLNDENDRANKADNQAHDFYHLTPQTNTTSTIVNVGNALQQQQQQQATFDHIDSTPPPLPPSSSTVRSRRPPPSVFQPHYDSSTTAPRDSYYTISGSKEVFASSPPTHTYPWTCCRYFYNGPYPNKPPVAPSSQQLQQQQQQSMQRYETSPLLVRRVENMHPSQPRYQPQPYNRTQSSTMMSTSQPPPGRLNVTNPNQSSSSALGLSTERATSDIKYLFSNSKEAIMPLCRANSEV